MDVDRNHNYYAGGVLVHKAVERVSETAGHIRIATPYGDAIQTMTRDALLARARVGSNLGGGIEIVIPQDSVAVTVQSHVSL